MAPSLSCRADALSQNEPESLAERYAADVAAKRSQIEVGRQRLVEARARELAENEAYALAQIRLRTDREAAQQAQALADAERKAELAAIERRSADLEATRAAKERAEAEHAAKAASEAHRAALKDAESAATQLLVARQEEAEALEARRRALREMKTATSTHRATRIRLALAGLAVMRPWKVALVTLFLGGGAGALWGYLQAPHRQSLPVTSGIEKPLRLDQTLSER